MVGQEDVYKEAMSQGHSAAWDQNWEAAAQQFRLALEEFPERKQPLTSLGLAYFELERFEEALQCYTRAAELSPTDPLPVDKSAQIFERNGNIKMAADKSMEAAELYIQIKDVEKAIENWTRVTRLQPEHLKAHARLALVHERLGRGAQAIREYISVAALLQDIGQIEEAIKTVERAAKVDPENKEGQQALELVKAYKTLPKPIAKEDPVKAKGVKAPELPAGMDKIKKESPDPIAESRQTALTALAEVLFDVSSDDVDQEKAANQGLRFVMPGGDSGPDFGKISRHLGRAIDLQTRANDDEAAKHLEKAIAEGLDFLPAFFNLGLLKFRMGDTEDARRNLRLSVGHKDYALAARLLMAQIDHVNGDMQHAIENYLEAVKFADISVAEPQIAQMLQEAYEPLIESFLSENEEDQEQLIQNVEDLLICPNWRQRISDARQQLPQQMTGRLVVPLAEMLTQARSSEMVSAIAHINELARQGHLRSAMEEAFILMEQAPTYLPLHSHMGELLLKQERVPEAITKFTMVASAYSSRGEPSRSTDLLRRIVEIAPLDLKARMRLIDQFNSQGQTELAIEELIDMADVQYRLAELDRARSTYQKALQVAQQGNVDRSFGVRILTQMADIDMQRLDWRSALLVFAQLRSLDPDDQRTRQNLVELNVRLNQLTQAEAELDNYLTHLSGAARDSEAIGFLTQMTEDSPELIFARRRLALAFQQANKVKEAIEQWKVIAQVMREQGNNEGSKEAIRAILVLNPPNAEEYRQMLQQL
jgi:tetratricopeptide (TPR) repeat protein